MNPWGYLLMYNVITVWVIKVIGFVSGYPGLQYQRWMHILSTNNVISMLLWFLCRLSIYLCVNQPLSTSMPNIVLLTAKHAGLRPNPATSKATVIAVNRPQYILYSRELTQITHLALHKTIYQKYLTVRVAKNKMNYKVNIPQLLSSVVSLLITKIRDPSLHKARPFLVG